MHRYIAAWMVACVLCLPVARAATQQAVTGVAAIANKRVITLEEIDNFAEPALRAVARQYVSRPEEWGRKRKEIINQAREELIDRQLILDEFASKGYAMPDSVIDEFVKKRIRQDFGDRLNLTRELQANQQTMEDFRKRMREEIIVSEMRNKNVSSQITISPKKIESFYATNQARFQLNEQVKLRMIILNEAKRKSGEAAQIAKDIVAKVRAGGKFTELANSFSDDAARNRGGDRGWVENKDADLREELRNVAFKLPVGTVSDPVVIEGNVFILFVEEKKPAGLRPLNDVRSEIESNLKAIEFERLAQAWTKRLRQKAFVRYF